MGLIKSTFAWNDSEVTKYWQASNVWQPDTTSMYKDWDRFLKIVDEWVLDQHVRYYGAACRIRVQTDAAGVSSLSFSGRWDGNATPGPWFGWKISTSSAFVDDGWEELEHTGSTSGTVSGTISAAAMIPNTTYYIWLRGKNGWNLQLYSPITLTASGTYGSPGPITAGDTEFDSPITISFASATAGGTYDVSVSVNGLTAETLQTNSADSSLTWAPSLSTYAPLITDAKSVEAVITVNTYFGGTLSGTVTKTITVSFTAAQVGLSIAAGTFSIAPYNIGQVSGLSGYIQNYSKIRATFDSSGVTLVSGATVAKWVATFGSTDVDVAAGTVTQDSGVISATTAVTCTVYDSRGFTASQSFTATIIPYQLPTMSYSVERCDANGVPASDGAYAFANVSVLYSALKTDPNNQATAQNTMGVQLFVKLANAADYPQTGLNVTDNSQTSPSGANNIFTAIHIYSGFLDVVYHAKLVATDRLGNKYETGNIIIESDAWFLHAYPRGEGAAFGKAAEYQNVLDVGSWDIYLRDSNDNIISLKTLLNIT